MTAKRENAYSYEIVDCSRCDGTGEILDDASPVAFDLFSRCHDCDGDGTIEVCSYCYDEWGVDCPECGGS